MKKVKRSFLAFLLLTSLFVLLGKVTQATEMNAEVGIEFTEIEPEPKPIPEPKPKPEPKPTMKKVIQLPQTSEKKSQGFTIVGSLLMMGTATFFYRRKSGVGKE